MPRRRKSHEPLSGSGIQIHEKHWSNKPCARKRVLFRTVGRSRDAGNPDELGEHRYTAGASDDAASSDGNHHPAFLFNALPPCRAIATTPAIRKHLQYSNPLTRRATQTAGNVHANGGNARPVNPECTLAQLGAAKCGGYCTVQRKRLYQQLLAR